MPILVQWKWRERTKSFLVIFHFFDDYSKLNLRVRKRHFIKNEKSVEYRKPIYLYVPSQTLFPEEVKDMEKRGFLSIGIRTTTTWAPSHVELGLLGELLSYANRINGLSETEKREVLKKMLIFVDKEKGIEECGSFEAYAKLHVENKTFLMGLESRKGKERASFCAELCPEYIDYLKKILKPYLN